MEAEALLQQAKNFELLGNSYPSVKDAVRAAKKRAASTDLIFVGGSTFVVAEVV